MISPFERYAEQHAPNIGLQYGPELGFGLVKDRIKSFTISAHQQLLLPEMPGMIVDKELIDIPIDIKPIVRLNVFPDKDSIARLHVQAVRYVLHNIYEPPAQVDPTEFILTYELEPDDTGLVLIQP